VTITEQNYGESATHCHHYQYANPNLFCKVFTKSNVLLTSYLSRSYVSKLTLLG